MAEGKESNLRKNITCILQNAAAKAAQGLESQHPGAPTVQEQKTEKQATSKKRKHVTFKKQLEEIRKIPAEGKERPLGRQYS